MLLDALREKDNIGLFKSDDTFVNYSTGILPLDFANGFWMTQINKDTGEYKRIPVPGVLGGKLILLFGETGSGKTTFAEQMAYSIIKPFDDGVMILVDAEQTALKERLCQITNGDQLDPRIILDVNHTAVEDVLDIINQICDTKEAGGKQYMYQPAIGDYTGQSFSAYAPTTIIIDSLRQFNPRTKDVVSLGTNMDNAREAQVIARFLDNIIIRINKYNITVVYTNHIQQKIQTSLYAPPPPRGLMLEPSTETLPRGSRPLFLAHTAIRINAIKSNLYTKEDTGFEGFMATMILAKSKTNYIGAVLNVAFNAAKGFDPIFTLYEFANQCGLIKGRNPYLYLDGMEDMKFRRKDFIEKMATDRNFNSRFMRSIYPYLEALLGAKEVTEDDRRRYGDYTDLPQDDEMISAATDVSGEIELPADTGIVIDTVRPSRKKKKAD